MVDGTLVSERPGAKTRRVTVTVVASRCDELEFIREEGFDMVDRTLVSERPGEKTRRVTVTVVASRCDELSD
ncbi:hypothetical protein TKK_0015554 [Trichogramma kaykai]